MNHAHIDFESYSELDLTKCGSDVYAKHRSTEILCMAYAIGSGDVQLWVPGDEPPTALLDHIKDEQIVIAHNFGGFEILMWNNICVKKYGWPPLKIENAQDTMPMAYAMGLPGSLEKAAAAVGIEKGKDMTGRRIMLQLCKPKKILDDGTFIRWDRVSYPEKYNTLYEYCKQDVEVERELYKRLVNLSPNEMKLWQLDWKINRRGVQIDAASLKAAIDLVEWEKSRLDSRMRDVTHNHVSTCSATGQFRSWLIYKNLDVPSIAKADVIDMLKQDIPIECREALELRQEASKTSTAKLVSMIKGLDSDGRVRGLFQYHGATTGRWAGRRIQLHNLPRPKMSQTQIEVMFGILEGIYGTGGQQHNS